MEFKELEVPVEKYSIISPSNSRSPNHSLNVRQLGRGDSRENWDPIRSAREREFREKPPPMLKIAVVGDSGVGKSTICEAFTSETGFTFSKKYHMTCGVQVYGKTIRIPLEGGGDETSIGLPFSNVSSTGMEVIKERVNLILLDSSSKDIYVELLPKYVRRKCYLLSITVNAENDVGLIFNNLSPTLGWPWNKWEKLDGVCVVVDVTNPTSLENSSTWLELVKPSLDNKGEILGVLLGNKTDCGEDRAIPLIKAQEMAQSLSLRYFEVTAKENSGLESPFVYLANEWATRKLPK